MRRLAAVLFTALAAGVGYTAWPRTTPEPTPTAPARRPPREVDSEQPASNDPRRGLDAARATCSLQALDEVIARLQTLAGAADASPSEWTLLGEAFLERAQQRTLLRGMTVGQPLFSELPPLLAKDLDAGAAAVAEARRRGDDSAASYRVEAALLSQRITGMLSALRYRGDIERALTAAAERDPEDPKLLVARGLQKLLAPRLLGHDPQAARETFERAHRNGGDERAAVFAAMACWLLEQPDEAKQWLEVAVDQNPANVYAQVVLARVRAASPDPFGRDDSEAEASAAVGR